VVKASLLAVFLASLNLKAAGAGVAVAAFFAAISALN